MKRRVFLMLLALCLCACGNDAITDSQTEGTESEKNQNTESELDTSLAVIPEPGVPDEELTLMQKVLFGKVDYYGATNLSNDNYGLHKITELEFFDGRNEHNEFGIWDLDGDGSEEVYFYFNTGDALVFHEEDGVVYGHMTTVRGFANVTKNGEFVLSAGAPDNYWGYNISFDKTDMRYSFVHMYNHSDGSSLFEAGIAVEGKQGWKVEKQEVITEDEWKKVSDKYMNSERVGEHAYTAENILKYVK